MAATSIPNPLMPVLQHIPGGFMHGRVIRIQGSVSHSAQRFAVNLQCGPNTNPRDDLALHINARIHERAVVRNSLIGGLWGQEERHASIFPFVPGQGFEILILADAHNYKIAINGQHFAEFRCRTPMERVSYLSADGEIMISMITFEGGSSHGVPGMVPMPIPVPVPVPVPMPGMPHAPSHHGHGHGHQAYPTPGMAYPSQPGMYPSQPGMYPAPGMQPHYGHLSPKSAPHYPDPSHSGGSGSGLSGLINKASTTMAGLGLATGVTGLLGSLTGGGGHRNAGYPTAGYPSAGYPGQPGYPSQHMGGSGGGGLLGGLGTAMGAAALGTALLNPKKAAKKQAKAQKKAMKYGLGAAGVGVGAYALHHGMKHHHHHGYHGHSSSSSSSSEEE